MLLWACGAGSQEPQSSAEPQSSEEPQSRSPDPGAVGDARCGHQGEAEPPPLAGITAAHNAVRCQVKRPSGEALPPLSWSQSLAAEAQRYADRLAKGGCGLEHSRTEHGENLFGGSGENTPAEVVERWAGERRCFHYDNFPAACSCTCGHYTQLVWADTRRLGCGMASCASGGEVWVCNYDPAGNYTGSTPY